MIADLLAQIGNKLAPPGPRMIGPAPACIECATCPAPTGTPPARCPTATCNTPDRIALAWIHGAQCPCIPNFVAPDLWSDAGGASTATMFQQAACNWQADFGTTILTPRATTTCLPGTASPGWTYHADLSPGILADWQLVIQARKPGFADRDLYVASFNTQTLHGCFTIRTEANSLVCGPPNGAIATGGSATLTPCQ